MIQGAALRPPILGQYHLKKFWLKKKEIEDAAEEMLNKSVLLVANSPSSSPPSSLPSMSATPSVQLKCSPPPSAVAAVAEASPAVEAPVCGDGASGSPLSARVQSSRDAEPQGRRDPATVSPRSTTAACADCKTEKTPLWRNGPLGPKSLCNACGIRYKKLGKRQVGNPATAPEAVVEGIEKKRKKKMMAKRWMRDEEEGALLLMALSSRQPLWTH
ncbi:GATA transcription factor 15-like [Nymphaea colorata]|nr:GATA transcription factor 15-like [Nymphaea colorata]